MATSKTTPVEASRPNHAALCALMADKKLVAITKRSARQLELEDMQRTNLAQCAAALTEIADSHTAEVEGRIVDAQHALHDALIAIWREWQKQPSRDLARAFAAAWRSAAASRLDMTGTAVREWEAMFPLFDLMLDSDPGRLQWLCDPTRFHFTNAWTGPVGKLHSALVQGADVASIFDLMTQVESASMHAASTAHHYPVTPQAHAIWDAVRYGGSSRAIDAALSEIHRNAAATVRQPAQAPAEFTGYGGSTFRTKVIPTGDDLGDVSLT